MQENISAAVTARPSATVVLIRKSEHDPEILMVRRRAGDAFGETYTFPGGVVDQDEAAAHAFCGGEKALQADTELGLTSGGLDFYSAAVRELFEETGVLLAQDQQGIWAFSGKANGASLRQDLRNKLDSGASPWAEILRSQQLFIACDALHYISFWETPLSLPKRWAARFFVAEMPPGQDAEHDGSELTDSCWMSATEILSASKRGGMKLPFPTLMTLRALAEFRTGDALLNWASAQSAASIRRVRPVILDRDGKKRFVIPGDPDYPQDE